MKQKIIGWTLIITGISIVAAVFGYFVHPVAIIFVFGAVIVACLIGVGVQILIELE